MIVLNKVYKQTKLYAILQVNAIIQVKAILCIHEEALERLDELTMSNTADQNTYGLH